MRQLKMIYPKPGAARKSELQTIRRLLAASR
jgi:hypothetical protein